MRIEQLILENLIYDSQYASLIGVFLKTEYFKAHPEKIVFSEIQDTDEEPVFSKTIHQNLKYGRLKYIFYCFLLVLDGFIGIVSLGQTQSIMANKYLLSIHVIGDYDEYR